MMHQIQSFAGIAGGENLDSLWQEFFRAPSNWWDDRRTKRSPRQPDFKHKVSKERLWMYSRHNPSWVKDELSRCGFLAVGQDIESAEAFPPSFIWTCCKTKDLWRGTRLHDQLQKRGLVEKEYSDALITLYAKCGELQKAQALMDMHNSSSVVPWTALIAGYARQGQGQKALDCFHSMQREGIRPNAVTYVCILQACTLMGAINKGKQFHDEILKQGLLKGSVELGNALVDMYVKCDDLPQACSVLEELPSRDVISWTALIAGYAQKGQAQQAFKCVAQMQLEGISPNARTYAYILKACAVIGAFDKGKEIHDEISKHGLLKHSVLLGGALVDMYAKCGALYLAQNVLDKLPARNIVAWSALIAGYVQKRQGQRALECYEQMQQEGIPPDVPTYVCLLKACATMRAINKGKQIHYEIVRQGLPEHNIEIGGALVDMYAECGALPQAQSALDKLPHCDTLLRLRNLVKRAEANRKKISNKCSDKAHI